MLIPTFPAVPAAPAWLGEGQGRGVTAGIWDGAAGSDS